MHALTQIKTTRALARARGVTQFAAESETKRTPQRDTKPLPERYWSCHVNLPSLQAKAVYTQESFFLPLILHNPLLLWRKLQQVNSPLLPDGWLHPVHALPIPLTLSKARPPPLLQVLVIALIVVVKVQSV